MKRVFLVSLILLQIGVLLAQTENIYGFTMNDIEGNPKSLGDYKGKVVLIVNVAANVV